MSYVTRVTLDLPLLFVLLTERQFMSSEVLSTEP